jgi:uncharacterized protein YggE
MNRLVKIALVSLLAAALPVHAQSGKEAGGDPIPALTVSGNGEARVAPDEVTVRLGVLGQAPNARAAQEQVNRIANAILDAVRKLGVAADDIQTQDLNLNPVYSQSQGQEGSEPRITGYQASNVVAIRLEKLELAGPVIDAGLAAGANRLDGVAFGLRNDRAARGKALTAAVAEARAKAQALARALNVRLVRILDVAEGGIQVAPQPLYKARMALEMSASSDTPVSSGQVGVSGAVTVRWEIAACPSEKDCQ